MKKNLGLKITALIFCLPGLAYGTPRLTGATRAKLVSGADTAIVTAALKESGIAGVDPAKLVKALGSKIIDADSLAKIMDNDSGKLEDGTRKSLLDLVEAEADFASIEAIPGSRLTLDKARAKLIRLGVEVDSGSSHSQASINSLAAAVTTPYKAGDMPSEALASLNAALALTATAEAKAQAEAEGKSLAELFANCK